jgi:hypothetical protein
VVQVGNQSNDLHDYGCGGGAAWSRCDEVDNGSDVAAWSLSGDSVFYSVASKFPPDADTFRVIAKFTYDHSKYEVTNMTLLTDELKQDARYPTVAPDGSTVAFLSKPTKKCSAPNAVYVVDTVMPHKLRELRCDTSMMYSDPQWSY